MKVYVVWESNYDGGELLGVFSTEEKAEKYKEQYSLTCGQWVTVNEMEVDQNYDYIARDGFYVSGGFFSNGEIYLNQSHASKILGNPNDDGYFYIKDSQNVGYWSFISGDHATKVCEDYLKGCEAS